MSRKRKDTRPRRLRHQPNTMRINQAVDGSIWYSVHVHAGRTTHRVAGPGSNDVGLAKEMFRSMMRGIN